MSDRELLTMAAKAAGIEITWENSLPHPQRIEYFRGLPNYFVWDPLADDGDALRLAAKLWISIGPEREGVIGQSLVRASWRGNTYSLGEYGGGDYYVAQRRAIVRAAAEIAKAMP